MTINDSNCWRQVWEEQSGATLPDFELDRGRPPRDVDTERLSECELLDFIAPVDSEVVLDAGCGTGVNIVRLHDRVKRIIGIDYARGSVERCRSKIETLRIRNADVFLASITAIPLPDSCVDKILCLSVLQYLNDDEVRKVLGELVRVLTPGGTLILHVKNMASIYWSTLLVGKRLKNLFGAHSKLYYLRSFEWYMKELALLGCELVDYNSFNLLTIDLMPRWLTAFLQKHELRHHSSLLLRLPFIRRHGADLKLKVTAGRSPQQA